MDRAKRIALTAHDGAKTALAAWAFANAAILASHRLTATANTGRLVVEETGLTVDLVRAGTLGGDLELGALIADGRIDILLFFNDPLGRTLSDVDPMPLLRVATLTQTAVALNEATADFLVRSELMTSAYPRPQGPRALPSRQPRLHARVPQAGA